MFLALFSAVASSASGAVAPVLRTSGFVAHIGTSWTSPAVNAGELIIAGRTSGGGGVQGMGADFTAFGDSASVTAVQDINIGWRIAGSSGSPTHTIPDNGTGIVYSIWQAGTFHPTVPLINWTVLQWPAENPVTLAVRTVTGGVGVYGSTSGVGGARVGLIAGATQMSLKTDATPFGRTIYRPAGWAAQNIANDPAGTVGQALTVWAYSIQGKP